VGFDPRRWQSTRSGSARITGDAEAIPAEFDDDLRQNWSRRQGAPKRPRVVVTVGAAPGITPELVRRWAEAMARHPRWHDLGMEGLLALGAHCHARGHDPSLPLEQALERRSPGLGQELAWALRGSRSRARLAVRAVFALHGARAPDLLDRNPLGLVDELLVALGIGPRQADRRSQGQSHGQTHGQSFGHSQGQSHRQRFSERPRDSREEALAVLGLERGASREAVKAAHRRLVKRHHPDMGGEVEAFRRIDAAYRLLIA
jgi:hypothetical protein